MFCGRSSKCRAQAGPRNTSHDDKKLSFGPALIRSSKRPVSLLTAVLLGVCPRLRSDTSMHRHLWNTDHAAARQGCLLRCRGTFRGNGPGVEPFETEHGDSTEGLSGSMAAMVTESLKFRAEE